MLALVVLSEGVRAGGTADPNSLPRFTEEREAAALYFVKKHLPELLPLLEALKKTSAEAYRRQVREIFHVTELLADIEDEKRYQLELKIWKAENRAYAVVAKLSTPKEDERKKAEAALHELARELVDLDIAILELKAEQLDRELGQVHDDLAKMREGADKLSKDRYQAIIEKVNGPRK
jgi:lysyl-tRNA synthetase class I